MKTQQAAIGKWRGILAHLGLGDEFLQNRHGPCPLCGGKDRYRFDDKDGTGSYFCSGCGAGDGMKLAIEFTGREFKPLAAEIDSFVGNIKPEKITKPKDNGRISDLFKYMIPAKHCPQVMDYLRARGLPCSSGVMAIKEMRYYEDGKHAGTFPAMIGQFISPLERLCTLHVTYLQGQGKAPVNAPKKVLTPIVEMAGGAIRLTSLYEHIGIAEGIETALAVMRDFKVPCWASGNAGMLEKFVLPCGVKSVTVYADNDENFTGQRSAYILANRLALAGVPVEVVVPKFVGDFADTRG